MCIHLIWDKSSATKMVDKAACITPIQIDTRIDAVPSDWLDEINCHGWDDRKPLRIKIQN